MSELAKGFRRGRFFDLSDRDKRDIITLMARVAEQAYRRGVQQGAGLAGKPSFRGDLWEWRYRPSLDLAPWVDRPTTTTSRGRLDAECGDQLRRLGLTFRDENHLRGSVWAGYTREQRRIIRVQHRNHPASPERYSEIRDTCLRPSRSITPAATGPRS